MRWFWKVFIRCIDLRDRRWPIYRAVNITRILKLFMRLRNMFKPREVCYLAMWWQSLILGHCKAEVFLEGGCPQKPEK